MTLHVRELAQEPARQIDEVNALVEQLAAAGDRRIGAPLLVVAEAAAVPVACPDEHQRTEHARIEQRVRLLERRMVAMVEADLDADARRSAAAMTGVSSSGARAAGFSTSTCFPASTAPSGDRRQRVVAGRHEHGVDVGAVDGGAPVGEHGRAAGLRREGLRALASRDRRSATTWSPGRSDRSRFPPMRPQPTMAILTTGSSRLAPISTAILGDDPPQGVDVALL